MYKLSCECRQRFTIRSCADVFFGQEPLTIIPIVVSVPKDGADELIGLMSAECSAKEVVMAVEEVVETLDRVLQTDEDEDEDDSESLRLSPSRQLVRILRAYSIGKSSLLAHQQLSITRF